MLIAKAEIGQAGADLRADTVNVDLRGWTNGLWLTSLADAVSSISLVFALSQVAYKLVYSSFMGLAGQPKAAAHA